MVMVQDSNTPSFQEKALRIMGDPMKCQRAREMVMDLITEKELENRGFNVSIQNRNTNNKSFHGGN